MPKKQIDSLRGTGRTSRMIEDAKKLAATGRAVYIIADNRSDKRRLEILIGGGNHGIKVETPELDFDWRRLQLVGMHKNCVVLVDHHAIEDRFGALLEMLHRYDA